MLKITRIFSGNYVADAAKLKALNYIIVRTPKPILTINTANKGFGVIKGRTLKLGASYSFVNVCIFNRNTRTLLSEVMSNSDGSYYIRNIPVGLQCFVVAFDPNQQYNAVIQDNVTTYDGRYK